jgi:hypothetical protein
MVYECWWDKQYGGQYAIRIENGHVTGWHKLAPDETVTTDSLPWIFYDTNPEEVAWCESIRSKSEVLFSVEVS